MADRIKVTSIELTEPIQTISDLDGYQKLQGLIRLNGVPLGYIFLPVVQGSCSAESIVSEAIARHHQTIASELIRQRLADPHPHPWELQSLIQRITTASTVTPEPQALPLLSVIICPRSLDPAPLADCLAALTAATQPLEVIVTVPEHRTYPSLQAAHPDVQWLVAASDSRSILRNQAVQVARGEIVAFIDEVCRVDNRWAAAIAAAFQQHADVSAVAGLVIPSDIQTDTATWFEQRYSRDRGTRRIWHYLDPQKSVPWTGLGTLWHSSGTNLAFRKSVFTQMGGFDPALDRAESTGTGADLEILTRLILAGQAWLHEPSAIVSYGPPTDLAALQAFATQEALGLYAYVAAGGQRYPQLRRHFATVGIWKFYHSLRSLIRAYGLPRRLMLAELMAIGRSWGAYTSAQKLTEPSLQEQQVSACQPMLVNLFPKTPRGKSQAFMAVRTVELDRPLLGWNDVEPYEKVRVFVTASGHPIGYVDIANDHRPLSSARLQQEIAAGLTSEILALAHTGNRDDAWSSFQTLLKNQLLPAIPTPTSETPLAPLADEVSVSIVITTCDRPDDLKTCLEHLLALETRRSVEIIVADNRPASGITPQVLAQFPGVKLVQEARPGAAYGRNAAIAASTGDIICTIDDDVTVPPDWLEKIVAPMARPEVMVVTGNVLPKELETPAQFLFEHLKGGLSQGYTAFEANGEWLAATTQGLPPVWDLGVSANAAFRADIFCHPHIGLLDEALGPGTPTCGGEECYLIYKVLRAGYTVVYEPSAYAWHRHRREMPALYHQVYSHMKGGMAFMLRVWLKEGDRRAFRHLFRQIPGYLKQRLIDWALKRHDAPLPFVWSEIRGYLDVFWCYRQSCQRLRRQGLSAPYIPVAQRHAPVPTAEITTVTACPDSLAVTSTSTVGG